MDVDQPVAYFNNCHNRDHVALFGAGAFFDLGTTGRQGTQARGLYPGQPCVVAEREPDNRITFDWYSFTYEALLLDEHGAPARAFFGRLFASEILPQEVAARTERYAALFRSKGRFKGQLNMGSFFHKAIPSDRIPSGNVEGHAHAGKDTRDAHTGAGFGDPAENKAVELAAVRVVVKTYEGGNWSVRSVERERCGFDLECSKDGVIENVEVKGVRGIAPCFIITAGEVAQARTNAKFVLVVVTSALSASPKLTKYSGAEFCQRFELSAIQYRAILKS